MLLREGGLIKDGYHEELDALRDLRSGGKAFIAQIEETERERTGIKNLKVGFNNVFGYYIEVTKASGHVAVPADYHRKQTTANAERYITPALKEYEAQVLGRGRKDRRAGVPALLPGARRSGRPLHRARPQARQGHRPPGRLRRPGRSRLAAALRPPRSP